MRKLHFVPLVLLAFFAFIATAAAGTAVSPEDGALLDLAKPVLDAIMKGQWWPAASLSLILIVAAIKKYAPGKAGEFFRTDIGASLLVLTSSFGGAAFTGLLAAGPGSMMTTAIAWTALKVAIGAAGGYTLLKKLLAPAIQKIAEKAPAWTKPFFTIILWAFSKPAPVAAATDAGNAAVLANPPTGTTGIAGPPTEL